LGVINYYTWSITLRHDLTYRHWGRLTIIRFEYCYFLYLHVWQLPVETACNKMSSTVWKSLLGWRRRLLERHSTRKNKYVPY